MALPYPTKVVLPFDIATAQDMNERHANDVALANGTGLDDGAVTPGKRSGGFASGSFTRTANGSLAVSGIPGFDFTPKFLKFNAVFGMPSATSGQASISVGSYNAETSVNQAVTTTVRADGGSGGYLSSTRCIRLLTTSGSGSGGEGGQANVSAIGNGTFTLNFANVDSTYGVHVTWEAYG